MHSQPEFILIEWGIRFFCYTCDGFDELGVLVGIGVSLVFRFFNVIVMKTEGFRISIFLRIDFCSFNVTFERQ